MKQYALLLLLLLLSPNIWPVENLKVAVCSRLPSTADRVFSPQIPHPFAAHAHKSCASEK
jgi:hypothetical protein